MDHVEKKEHIFSLVYVTVLLGILWSLFPIRFETNDDTGIMYYLAGYNTGEPMAASIYCKYLFGKFISVLYTWFDAYPWYTYVYCILFWLSLITIFKSMLKIARYNSLNYIYPFLIFTSLSVGLYSYSAVLLQFTTVSAICGTAVVCVLFAIRENDSKCSRIIDLCIMIVLFLFCYNIRAKVGYMAMAAIVGSVMLYMLIAKNKKRIVFALCLFGMLFALSEGINVLYEHVNHWEDFREWHPERGRWTDYPHLSYAEAPELYNELGWDDTLYNLATSWFFMDENITTDSFKVLNDTMDEKEESFEEKWEQAIWRIKSTDSNKLIIIYFLGTFILVIVLLCKRDYIRALGNVAYFMAFLLMILLFSMLGRLPLRVILACAFLTITPQILMDIECIKLFSLKKVGAVILCSFLVLGGSWYWRIIPDKVSAYESGIFTKKQVESYVIQNLDNVYIFDITLALSGDPFQVYTEEKPYNLIFYGGGRYYSPLYYMQLNKNGYKTIYAEDFFDENIYFIGASEPYVPLVEYMQKRFPKCSCKVTEQGEGFIVYKFSR